MSFIKDLLNAESLYFFGGMLTKLIADNKNIKVCSLKFFVIALIIFVIIGTINAFIRL